MSILLFLILLLIALFAYGFWTSARAKRQYETVTSLSPARARQVIEDSFSKVLWADVQGPGDINKRRRTINDSGAVISIHVQPVDDGRTHVTAWMSAWKTKYGMVASGGWALAKKVITRIDQAA